MQPWATRSQQFEDEVQPVNLNIEPPALFKKKRDSINEHDL
jgi:hypothetical protein